MELSLTPFLDGEYRGELRDAWLLNEVARERSKRQVTKDRTNPDEVLGLDRLATFIDTIRIAEGVTWKQFALSATPKPFNPVYMMLMSMSLISRKEITSEVFSALERRLLVHSTTLRSMFRIEEVEQPKGVIGLLRMPRIRISAPFDTFTSHAPVAAVLGEGQKGSHGEEAGESVFEQSGFKARYRQSTEEGFIASVEAIPGSGRRVPRDMTVTIVSAADGSIKAGPFVLERGRAECGHVDAEPLDRLIVEWG